jgi:hypothetical protein
LKNLKITKKRKVKKKTGNWETEKWEIGKREMEFKF